jgi:hypothetical protein
MAFSKGISNTASFAKMLGFCDVKVVALNPNAKQIKELTGKEYEENPEYLGEVERNDKTVKVMRFSFYLQPEVKFWNRITVLNMFVENNIEMSKDGKKCRVIDKYGRNKWVEVEVVKAKQPIERIDKDYRPALRGEVELTNFLRAYLCISSPEKYVQDENKWVLKSDNELKECESQFTMEDWGKVFKNDISPINEVLAYQPNASVKVLMYVKCTKDGALYQAVYDKDFLKKNSKESSFERFKKTITNEQKNGYGTNNIYEFGPARIVEDIAPTSVSETTTENDPFADTAEDDISADEDELPFG